MTGDQVASKNSGTPVVVMKNLTKQYGSFTALDDLNLTLNSGQILGLIAPEDVRRIAKDRWANTTVSEVMRPLRSLHPLEPSVPAMEAVTVMGREHLDQVPVVANDGHLEGVVTRSYLSRILQLRSQFQSGTP